tara:strand:+ start:256 stop:441 length:186 start_codon:yes stop_codon:yes gene_type:complete
LDYSDTIYPACVGLSRIGDYPNIVNELWNDGVTRKVPWYLRIFPMKYIDWNRNGSYFSLFK